MTQKFSPQTKSFIVLFIIAVVGTFVCVNIYMQMPEQKDFSNYYTQKGLNVISYSPPKHGIKNTRNQNLLYPEPIPPIDTTDWQTYTDTQHNLAFKYPADWQIKPKKTKNGFDVLEVDPGKKYYNIKIYINPQQFYAVEGLPATEESLSGYTATNVRNMLYGVKTPNYAYTFDVGMSLSLVPKFNALVHTVKFL